MPFAGGIDGWRLVDRGEAAASVDEGRDELGKAARSLEKFISDEREARTMPQIVDHVQEKTLDPLLVAGILALVGLAMAVQILTF